MDFGARSTKTDIGRACHLQLLAGEWRWLRACCLRLRGRGVLRQIGFEQANFRVARDASAVGNGKQRKARSLTQSPTTIARPVL